MMRYMKDVVTLELDTGRCTGCSMCIVVCPHAVFELRNAKATIVDRDACMECGACALNCPVDAITVEAGVGCAAAVLHGTITGTEPQCGCCGEPDGPAAGKPQGPCCR
jgi:NAD-dependent dihydropyrimidine dehydrogenase PreA subunit